MPQSNREKFFKAMNIVARNTGEKMRVKLDHLPPSKISKTVTIDELENIFQIDVSPTPPPTRVSTLKRKRSSPNISLNILSLALALVIEEERNEEDIMNIQKYHDVFKSLEQLIREYIHDIMNKEDIEDKL